MPVRPVVVNSTPLVAFWAVGRLDILRSLFGEIMIPPAVREEFLSAEKETRQKTLKDETGSGSLTSSIPTGQERSRLSMRAKRKCWRWRRNNAPPSC